jgi:hypothetical protein
VDTARFRLSGNCGAGFVLPADRYCSEIIGNSATLGGGGLFLTAAAGQDALAELTRMSVWGNASFVSGRAISVAGVRGAA